MKLSTNEIKSSLDAQFNAIFGGPLTQDAKATVPDARTLRDIQQIKPAVIVLGGPIHKATHSGNDTQQ